TNDTQGRPHAPRSYILDYYYPQELEIFTLKFCSVISCKLILGFDLALLMILEAINALNEKLGSNKSEIGKHIEITHLDL
ncbi:hypothetical protein Gotri_022796, partial [Gossypium trilobum]|nr:hypothetical protein [Gossypium trilobum]